MKKNEEDDRVGFLEGFRPSHIQTTSTNNTLSLSLSLSICICIGEEVSVCIIVFVC